MGAVCNWLRAIQSFADGVRPTVARRDSPGGSQVATELISEHYDDENYQQQTQSAARIVSPVRAIWPSGKRAQDEQDQDDQQD